MIAVNAGAACREFDGTDDYVDIGEVSALKPTTADFTITGWFKIASMPAGTQYLFGYDTKGYFGYIDGANGKLVFGFEWSSGNFLLEEDIGYWYTDNRWHCFVLLRDYVSGLTSGAFRLYIDGAYIDGISTTTYPAYVSGEKLALGRKGGASSNYFKGCLRDFRFYDYNLSYEEAEAFPTTNPTTPPISQWLLDETSGSTANDNVGSNDGTFYGGTGLVKSSVSIKDIPTQDQIQVKVGSDWKIPKNIFIKSSTWKHVHDPTEIYHPDIPARGEPSWYAVDADSIRTVTFASDKISMWHDNTGTTTEHRLRFYKNGKTYDLRHTIDLTDISTIYIDWEYLRTYGSSNYCSATFGIKTTWDTTIFTASAYRQYGFSRVTDSINVSSRTGEWYLELRSLNNRSGYERTLNVYRIWGV